MEQLILQILVYQDDMVLEEVQVVDLIITVEVVQQDVMLAEEEIFHQLVLHREILEVKVNIILHYLIQVIILEMVVVVELVEQEEILLVQNKWV